MKKATVIGGLLLLFNSRLLPISTYTPVGSSLTVDSNHRGIYLISANEQTRTALPVLLHSVGICGSGKWDRTTDLWVMNPAF